MDELGLALGVVAVDGARRDAGGGDDLVHRHGVEAVVGEAGARGPQDALRLTVPVLLAHPWHGLIITAAAGTPSGAT